MLWALRVLVPLWPCVTVGNRKVMSSKGAVLLRRRWNALVFLLSNTALT